jgi:hypothetical protein
MTSFDVVTTFAVRHWKQHARRCVKSFGAYWSDIPLMTFTDAALQHESRWLTAFKERHARRPKDNYRFDAVRFAHKIAAVDVALRAGSADVLIWMDADCVTHQPVDAAWLSDLLGDADFGYLRRARKYPECGFLMIRRNDAGRRLVAGLVDLYETDRLFDLAEWHDSWAIEQVRAHLESHGQLSCVSLSGDAEHTGHPFVNGPLGARMDHCKGERKKSGRSKPSDLKTHRQEPYWSA